VEPPSTEEVAAEFWCDDALSLGLDPAWAADDEIVQLDDALPLVLPSHAAPARAARDVKLVEEDHKALVDAAIVRALKAHEQLQYGELMAQIGVKLAPRLRPDAALVRDSIERLIDGEYIARHEQERDVFLYLP